MATFFSMAGVEGLEPSQAVLETDVLPLTLYPYKQSKIIITQKKEKYNTFYKKFTKLLKKLNNSDFGEEKRDITYSDFVKDAKLIGTNIIKNTTVEKQPIVIFIDKTINCLEAMMGVLYSGNFYTIIDTKSPEERAKNIIETLDSKIIIADNKNISKLKKYEFIEEKDNTKILMFEELLEGKINQEKLGKIREKQIDTDAMYVLFTSGSTGIPKGTVVTHKSVLAYTNWVKKCFDINENTIFGSQTPFYFSMSISDIFTTMLAGGTLYIIPKMYFSFPIKLIEYLKEKEINTIYWVPSALCIVANLGALKDIDLPDMKKILFAGEVMPVKQLNMWRKALPNCMYANLYGPTETTDICTYYIVDRDFENNETLPIGKHCDNCNIILLAENGQEAKEGEQGEILVRGSFLAEGYYGNLNKTKEVFIQNPINNKYPEIVYRTGDIGKYNEKGELIYLSRKDYQIKHMGYRIELGEIEKNIYSVDKIVLCACIYDEVNQKIVLFYQGDIEECELAKTLDERLLPYMRPNKYIKLSKIPYNSNGKIDRIKLKEQII